MIDDLHLTDEQLHLATSRLLPSATPLDAETAAARETYLARGVGLENAAKKFDEAALLSNISRERTCSRSSPTQTWWPLIIYGALAASALIAITRISTSLLPSDPKV